MRKLRILGLHGYHGSAETLRRQVRPIAAALEREAELVFVDAPALAAGDFGWWHATEDASGARHYRGSSRTRTWLAAVCRAAPFDGVFGFSQGAALAALLVALCACDPSVEPRFGFALLVGGFTSADPDHAAAFDAPGGIDVPSLHVVGRSDTIVSPDASRALASRFRAPVIVEHDGGHVIPGAPDVAAAVSQFLRDRRADSKPMTLTPDVPVDVPLWPGRERPAMRMFVPPDMTQPRHALVIFRGGGYSTPNGSGARTGAWAAQHGIVAFEVDYGTRSTRSFYPQPFADGARAVRLVRAHAREWGIDPKRVGVLGYSAGGHLASLLGTQPSLWTSPDDDLASSISARPDLVVLAYPLLSFVDGYEPGAYMGSVDSFFGRAEVSEAERRLVSSELHVESTHPPVFLWTTADDTIVPASQSEQFAAACRRAHVPITFLLFPHGPHAMGLALDDRGEVGTWTAQLLAWLDQQWGAASSRP